MSFTSDDVNLLIFNYLCESGMEHSAFSFFHESLLNESDLMDTRVMPGQLITHLQKGLLYSDLEEHLQEDGSLNECSSVFNLIHPHVCKPQTTKIPLLLDGHLRKLDFIKRKHVFYTLFSSKFPYLACFTESCVVVHHLNLVNGGFPSGTEPRISIDEKAVDLSRILAKYEEKDIVANTQVTCMCWHPSNANLTVGTKSGHIVSLFVDDSSIPKISDTNMSKILRMRWHDSAEFLLCLAKDGKVTVFTHDLTLQQSWQAFDFPAFQCRWNPLNRTQFTVSSKNSQDLLIFTLGEEEPQRINCPWNVDQFSYSLTAEYLAISGNGIVQIYSFKEQRVIRETMLGTTPLDLIWYLGVNEVEYVLTGPHENFAILKIPATPSSPNDEPEPLITTSASGEMTAIAISPGHKYLAFGYRSRWLFFFNLLTGKIVMRTYLNSSIDHIHWKTDEIFAVTSNETNRSSFVWLGHIDELIPLTAGDSENFENSVPMIQ
eukprot:TRINITY_DN3191_c4_g10_i1.p1 TRINITY_DN3191_c4_g10~~TRINITY_DN3191_c4_g10_i1.p1  ORF type:complete len:489 (+),score=127.03 TRINITY_DN3191_c4_g10_i1:32-1498(+)